MAMYLDPVSDGRQIVLDKAIILIGRQADCDVILNTSRKVSRKHCCIAQVNDHYVVRDLASMNGVRVNGQRVKRESPLGLGDEIAFGDVCYILRDTNVDQPQSNGSVKQAPEVLAEDEPVESSQPEKKPLIDPPANISQPFPVPIADDEGVDFAVEASMQLDRPPLESIESYEDQVGSNDESEPEQAIVEDSGEEKKS